VPRFDPVEVTRGLPASTAVPQVSPEAFGAGVGRALAQLGSVLTEQGRQRAALTEKLRREREITERTTGLAQQLEAARDTLRRQTNPDEVRRLRQDLLADLDDAIDETDDPVVRETVRRQAATWRLSFGADVDDRLFRLETDRGRAAIRDAMETRKQLAVSASDPVTRSLAEREHADLARQGVDLGFFTAEEMTGHARTDRSQMHVLTLDRMLAAGDDPGARAYLANVQGRGELLAVRVS